MRPYARTENQAAAQERVRVAAQEDGCCDVVAVQAIAMEDATKEKLLL